MGALTLLLALILAGVLLVQSESLKPLRRSKRRWVLTTIVLEEGDTGPFPKIAGELFNDRAINMTIKYLISGPGVDEFPEPGLFSVDDATGVVYVHRTIDREVTPMFTVCFDVADRASGRIVDKSLIFNVEVKDKNDNAPIFLQNEYNVTIKETSALENPVLQMIAQDKDKEDTLNSVVIYSLVSQTPDSPVTFTIDAKNGLIRGKGCLNYETVKMVRIIVRARDDGSPPMSSTATVNVIVESGNTHSPVIIGKQYEGKILEGQTSTNVSRIRVGDKDIRKTPAWRAKFKILSGNEKGNYNITTDPETNEGLLSIIKPLDFEGGPERNLVISVENEEPFFICEKGKMTMQDKSSPITVGMKVNVVDINDAPYFTPAKLIVREKEGLKPGTVLARCNATDTDLIPNKIRYKLAYDPEGWVTVDENTGVVTTVKELDRESPYVNNSIYNIIIHAVDDGEPPQTGTGTVVLYVSDINDNMPYLLSRYMEVCDQVRKPSVTVQAADRDIEPFAGPFSFEMADESKKVKETWKFGKITEDSAELLLRENMPKGNHSVALNIYDRQGHSGTENLVVRICSCPDGRICEKLEPAAHFLGGGSIAVMLAALLLFLLALLLLTCLVCGSSKKHGGLPPFDDGNQTLIKYNEEGGSSLSQASPSVLDSAPKVGNEPDIYYRNRNTAGASPIKGQDKNDGYMTQNIVGTMPFVAIKGQEKNAGFITQASPGWITRNTKSEKWRSTGLSSPRQSQKEKLYENGTFVRKTHHQNPPPDAFTEQVGEMVAKRLHGLRELEDGLASYKPRIYAYEGELERIDSVDSFTFLDEPEQDFLDSLGPKFATLGELIQK
ncbi:cadherin-like protein 26 [Ambystoma mexicanum]|uniref:cadherin-like protein 26 n=1 Tax=Ambystoma mexicanum TaxID=8296 RepID=UPI0037E9B271